MPAPASAPPTPWAGRARTPARPLGACTTWPAQRPPARSAPQPQQSCSALAPSPPLLPPPRASALSAASWRRACRLWRRGCRCRARPRGCWRPPAPPPPSRAAGPGAPPAGPAAPASGPAAVVQPASERASRPRRQGGPCPCARQVSAGGPPWPWLLHPCGTVWAPMAGSGGVRGASHPRRRGGLGPSSHGARPPSGASGRAPLPRAPSARPWQPPPPPSHPSCGHMAQRVLGAPRRATAERDRSRPRPRRRPPRRPSP
mmetsp:Transcript_177166/g.431007  ORF Transcript_177166/g.431007 Transcript_177166/m.431007 type:complete len:259 (-) Transcript_177166:2-778(-)